MGCCNSTDANDREKDFTDMENASGDKRTRGRGKNTSGKASKYATNNGAGDDDDGDINDDTVPPPIAITSSDGDQVLPPAPGTAATTIVVSEGGGAATTTNIARAAMLPEDDVEAARKEKEALRLQGDVKGPKMMEFELEMDDVIIEADDEAVIEQFNADDFETPEKNAKKNNMNEPGSATTRESLEGFRAFSDERHSGDDNEENGNTTAEASRRHSSAGGGPTMMMDDGNNEPPTAEWFIANGFKTPTVVWWQTPTEVHIEISPADAGNTGWEIVDQYKISYSTTTIHGKDFGVELRLFKTVEDVKFVIEDEHLHISGFKCKAKERWTQLLRGSRKAYFDLQWISKDMTREVDDDDDDDE